MWQRLQTLYLAVASALLISMFFTRFATIAAPEGGELTIMYYEKAGYLTLLIVTLAANLISLFAFKKRVLQMRLAMFAAIVLVGFQILIIVDAIKVWNDMSFSVTALFPLVCIVLDVLAARAIMTDEAMVQSASRLRDYKKRHKR